MALLRIFPGSRAKMRLRENACDEIGLDHSHNRKVVICPILIGDSIGQAEVMNRFKYPWLALQL
jgi:hypothetical protein